jgi:hypothetical protein
MHSVIGGFLLGLWSFGRPFTTEVILGFTVANAI